MLTEENYFRSNAKERGFLVNRSVEEILNRQHVFATGHPGKISFIKLIKMLMKHLTTSDSVAPIESYF